MNLTVNVLLVGAGATAIADLWGVVRRPLLGVAPPDYRMVGRWFAHMRQGRFRHDSISAAQMFPGEHLVGWIIHYLTGIFFAALLFALVGADWLQRPTLGPAMAVGIGTVLAPFLLMQPAMGAGIAARRTPRPASARLQSLLMHAAFGFGLYASARALQMLQVN